MERSSDNKLERALSEGGVSQLPPNKPKGMLGDVAPDLYKPEDYAPDLNAGISQENDAPVVILTIALAYLLFFPMAYAILWRTRVFGRRTKVVASVVMAVGVGAVGWLLLAG